MGKSKKMFNREREQQLPTQTLASFIDDEYQVAEYHHRQQREVLNEIFAAWGDIFGDAKQTKFNLKKNTNEKRNI